MECGHGKRLHSIPWEYFAKHRDTDPDHDWGWHPQTNPGIEKKSDIYSFCLELRRDATLPKEIREKDTLSLAAEMMKMVQSQIWRLVL
jgi:hypothetical protein